MEQSFGSSHRTLLVRGDCEFWTGWAFVGYMHHTVNLTSTLEKAFGVNSMNLQPSVPHRMN